ncbi:ATP synthase, delta/Epsilon chain, beta-sandwich domain-containing protein [Rhizoctonia solani AG-1 IA]|uniref:ATP synthase subunit delta, mitochondrial n=1 Tax=Thanatephorus cucumeris (strain AG1-IA) TaxID=983506 RepID=L8WRD4_THACA|nr:ATP synthase, delta/Epsilon chain, beta-sandwich domain-containing protein [Rhizoctonia solani AG-1 IA]
MSVFVRTAANSIRAATARNTLRQTAYIQRRGYADAASDTLKLSLVLPHQSIFTSANVVQVNIAAESGDMGILANHVPTVEPLRPGVVEVIETGSGSKKWFGELLNITAPESLHPNNTLTINAIEAAPLEDISAEAVRANLAEAQRVLGGSASDKEKAEARIEADVYEAIQQALSK